MMKYQTTQKSIWILIIIAMYLQPLSAKILFRENFNDIKEWGQEGYNPLKDTPTKRAAPSAETYLPEDEKSADQKSLKIFFPRNQHDKSSMGKRVEIKVNDPQLTRFFQPRWYAFSIFVPKNYGKTAQHIVFQFHGRPDNLRGKKPNKDEWRSPPFAISTDGEVWNCAIRYSELYWNPDGNKQTRSVKVPWKTKPPAVCKGSWSHWVMQINWDYRLNSKGQVKVWLQDEKNTHPELLIDYQGPVGFYDDRPAYIKMGIYYYRNNLKEWPAEIKSKTLYYDRFLVGNTEENLKSMMYHPPEKK